MATTLTTKGVFYINAIAFTFLNENTHTATLNMRSLKVNNIHIFNYFVRIEKFWITKLNICVIREILCLCQCA